jgi:hypothetical protein
MNVFRYSTAACLLAATTTTLRAGDDVLAPGDPPLTRAIADRKIDFWEWVFAQRLDDRQRAELRQLQVREWGRNDREWKARWIHFLDVWRDATAAGGANADRLRAGIRRAALDSLGGGDADAVGRWLLARPAAPAAVGLPGGVASANNPDAIAMQVLMRRQEQHNQMMRMMSDAQARHHETMMLIIRNIGPSGRYVYNGATGRYDRWESYP